MLAESALPLRCLDNRLVLATDAGSVIFSSASSVANAALPLAFSAASASAAAESAVCTSSCLLPSAASF